MKLPPTPVTPQEWLAASAHVLDGVLDHLRGYGIAPHPELRLIDGQAPNPYYDAATRSIGTSMPDPAQVKGRLYWLFAARIHGVATVEEAIQASYEQLPLLLAHELCHHLRHQYLARTASSFVEEQVCDVFAVAFIKDVPSLLPTLGQVAARLRSSLGALSAVTPETVTHLAGARLSASQVLMSTHAREAGRVRMLRDVAAATGADLDEVLEEAGIAPEAVGAAAAASAASAAYFNERYMQDLFEYTLFHAEWLAADIDDPALPRLGAVIEEHVLCASWEQAGEKDTERLLRGALVHPSDELATTAAALLADQDPASLLRWTRTARPAVRADVLWRLAAAGAASPETDAEAAALTALAEPAAASRLIAYELVRASGATALAGLPLLVLEEVLALLSTIEPVEHLGAAVLPVAAATTATTVALRCACAHPVDEGAPLLAGLLTSEDAELRDRAATGLARLDSAVVAAAVAAPLAGLAARAERLSGSSAGPVANPWHDLLEQAVIQERARVSRQVVELDAAATGAGRAALAARTLRFGGPELVAEALAIARPALSATSVQVLDALAQPRRGADLRALAEYPSVLVAGLARLAAGEREDPAVLSMLEKVLLLRSVELLRDVELDELRQIADDAVVRCFEDGQHVFTFGDAGTDMYVVTDGTVALEQEVGGTGDVRRVATVGPRGYFGETAMFHDEPRTAQAVAVGRVELLQLDRETVLRLGRRRPEVLVNIVRVLSERLRQADADLG